jgi:MFS family permease
MSAHAERPDTFETDIPSRLDRLPWARWHWLVVIALGAVWILDGLEVTIVGGIGPTLQTSLHFSATQVGALGSIYVAGAVCGALVFGYLTDRLGRKRLFMVTLGVYLVATAATAFSWSFWSFAVFRFFTGAGIGGEYSAINSAIDELIPARVRGWVDLAINGSYWAGAAVGAAITYPLLTGFSTDLGWRLVFASGAILGIFVLVTRRFLPESPRWLMTHDRIDEANAIVKEIEQEVERDADVRSLPEPEGGTIEIEPRGPLGFGEIARTMLGRFPRRSLLGFTLMSSQAFFYNAIFFTYALVLTTFMGVSPNVATLYLIPFALGNLVGPLVLGRLFDTVGRRAMIGGCYIVAAVLMAGAGWLFQHGTLTATTLTIAWSVIFFFASAGASAAYLTVSEVFPLELRAMAIAFFYAISTAIGGITGPLIFGALIGSKNPTTLYVGYVVGAALMLVAGVLELIIGVDAEQESLEEIAEPMSATGDGDSQQRHAPRTRRPGMRTQYSPRPAYSGSWRSEDPDLDREIDAIARLLDQTGPQTRQSIGERLGTRFWGPGRLGRALAIGSAEGRIRRLQRGMYAAPHGTATVTARTSMPTSAGPAARS